VKSEPRTSPEFDRFNALVGKVVSIPPETLKRRLEEDQAAYKPKKKKAKAKKTPPR
jgi:hypothetical protein